MVGSPFLFSESISSSLVWVKGHPLIVKTAFGGR
jgi:hypothetical protein